MDRDDSALALITTAPATTAPLSFTDRIVRLPDDCRNEALALDKIMLAIDGAKKKRTFIKDHLAVQFAGQPGRSAETLKRLYYRWKAHGLAGVIDHRKCGGCGLADCKHEREALLPQTVIQQWQEAAITNDKRGLTESWKAIIRALVAGETLEGVGTWRDLFAQAHPFREPPARCPWSLHRPPTGWSLSTFLTHKVPDVVYALAQKGSFAAWQHLPEVRVDLTTLRPFEWLVVDDHRLDFKVYVDVPGRGTQLVELWGLFVMDVATRMIVSFALKPRIEREDGTFMAFEHRDMQHLIFHVLSTYGIPQGYDQTWIVENAAAAVSTDTENLVAFISSGRVKIKRTGIQVGDFKLSGFPERWGNYRGKRWLEVWFAALDIVLGGVKGQMGSDYWSKPGSFDARQAFGNRLLKLLDKCTPDIRARLELPFEWAGEAHWLVGDAIELLNHRNDHHLEGFEQVRFFAFDPSSPMIPLHPQLALLHGCEQQLASFSQVPTSLQEQWLAYGGTPRCITPAEKMALQSPQFDRLSQEAMLDLLFDEVSTWKGAPLIYRGGDVLDIEVRRGRQRLKARFAGQLPGVEIGARLIARVNNDRLECGAWILDEKRRFVGHLTFRDAPTHDDIEGLHRELGAQIHAVKQATGIVQRITNRRAKTQQRIGELKELTATINTLREEAAPPQALVPALPESKELAHAIMTTKGQARTRPLSDAEAYLELLANEPADTCFVTPDD